jgi:hypothetical protein
MAAQFGMTEGIYSGERGLCSDPKCGRYVEDGDPCFFDANGDLWCNACGRCERYSRKKEHQRNQVRENQNVIRN